MSHIKNVEAFEKLVGICAGYGDKYNPAQANLQVQNLFNLLNGARKKLNDVGAAKTNYDNATNAREVAYTDLDQLAKRILGELKSSGVLDQTVSDANSMVRKITGYRANNRLPVSSPVAAALAPTNEVISKRTARGLDYGSLAQHFEKLVQTISVEPAYRPNTTDLKVDALSNHLQTLRIGNTGVVYAHASLSEARNKRNAFFYKDYSNLIKTARAVKEQVRATFGSNSAAFAEVNKIRFAKPIK